MSRLGEICLSPELAHVMLFPVHALAYQANFTTPKNFPDERRAACTDPLTVLAAMDDLPETSASLTEAGKFLAAFQLATLYESVPATQRQPVHLCAWRLDLPSRVCLYTGEHPANPAALDLSTFSPHMLSKVLLDDRSRRPSPSVIHTLQPNDISAGAVRTSMLHYAQTRLTPYLHHGTAHAKSLDHTLEEALACLVFPPPRNHTAIALHESPPWDKDHIDSRYSSTNQTHTRLCLRRQARLV